jgi:glycosyltransferase involved in cell wall biosynthesis
VADIVEHERTGLLAPSGDAAGLAGAVILLLSDAAYRSRLAAAGREAAAGFAKAGAAPRIAALYRNLLKPQAGEARDAGGSPSI